MLGTQVVCMCVNVTQVVIIVRSVDKYLCKFGHFCNLGLKNLMCKVYFENYDFGP